MEAAENHGPKGPAVRREVPKPRGGWERDGPTTGGAPRTPAGRSCHALEGSAAVGLGPGVWGPGWGMEAAGTSRGRTYGAGRRLKAMGRPRGQKWG